MSARDDDESLALRCREGDGAAFAALVIRFQRPIYNAAYRVLGNPDDAADITQVVFLKLAERIDEYDTKYRFFSWIYRIALNESLNLLRRNGREQPLDEDAELPGPERADPAWQASEAQRSRRIQAALMRMKVEDRAVITLRHFSECSYREIAQILELDEKTVKSRLFEARQRLKDMLKDLIPA